MHISYFVFLSCVDFRILWRAVLLSQSLRTDAGQSTAGAAGQITGAAGQSTASRGERARPLSHGARTLSLPTRLDRCRLV